MVAVSGLRDRIDRTELERSLSGVRGPIYRDGDVPYDEVRAIWNGMIEVRPDIIVSALDEEDVRQVVLAAAASGAQLSVRGGGHNVAGLSLVEGGITLDLSRMRAVHIDALQRRAFVQGGALWSDLDEASAPFGLATTGGVISHTGVAGLTLGGGIGWLVGKHGMAIDNLASARVVTANGDAVVASEHENTELFWALRGGGGNFGVVTEFEFMLHEQGDILGGLLVYPINAAAEVLAAYREFTESAPEQLGLYAEPTTDPETGERIFVLAFFWPGDLAEGTQVLNDLKSRIPPMLDAVQVVPYGDFQKAFDPAFPHGTRYYWKGTLMESLEPAVLDAIVQQASHPPFPGSTAVLEWYRGPMNRVDRSATAFANRQAQYQVVIVAAWDQPADDQTGIEWAQRLHRDIAPYGLSQGFLNFNSLESGDGVDVVRASFGDNWERLKSVKAQYDPTNLFRLNHNIPAS